MAPIGKGLLLVMTRAGESNDFMARVITFVAIYSAVGIRDAGLEAAIGAALARNPVPDIRRLRRDSHPADGRCWLHGPSCCFSLDGVP